MNEIARTIWAGFAGATWLDQVNCALGITGVVLMARRTLWAFPVGMVAVSVQCALFLRDRFPADAALQVFFFVTLGWGWRHWMRDRGAAPELPVTRLGSRGFLVTLALAGAAMSGWAVWVAPRVGALMPWRDAFIAAFSVAAQVLQARKNIENWPLWLVVNAVAVASYWKAELAYTAFLYAVYFFLAVGGWRSWRAAMLTRSVVGSAKQGDMA